MMRRLLVLALILSLSLFIAGCSHAPDVPEDPEDPQDPEDPETVVEAVEASIGVLWEGELPAHPLLDWPGSGDNPALGLLHPPIARITAGGALEPNLGFGIWFSGERRILLEVPRGLHWSDGEPVVPADLVLALETLIDPAFPGSSPSDDLDFIRGAGAYRRGEATEISGLSVREDRLEMRLEYATPRAAWALARLTPLPSATLEGMDKADIGGALVGGTLPTLGAFRKVGSTEDSDRVSWILERVPEEDGEPDGYPERLLFHYASDLGAGIPEMGDILYIPPGRAADAADVPGDLRVLGTVPAGAVEYLGFNTAGDFLADPRIRRALAHSVDRSAAARLLFGETGTEATGPLAGLEDDASPSDGVRRDLDRARELLEEAGYGEDGDRIPELYLLYPGDDSRRASTAAALAENAAEIGITLHTIPADRNLLLHAVYGRKRYDLYLLAAPLATLSCPATWETDNPWSYRIEGEATGSFEFLMRGSDVEPSWEWIDPVARDLPILALAYPSGVILGDAERPDIEAWRDPPLGNVSNWIGFFEEGN